MPSSSASNGSGFQLALDMRTASRFAKIALGHVTREYPNRLDHVLTGPADLKRPRALHPLFYGSFDWHSCVHSYWLLSRIHRLFPALSVSSTIRCVINHHFTVSNVAGELDYYSGLMLGYWIAANSPACSKIRNVCPGNPT